MNTPYQSARLKDAYQATDTDGRTAFVAMFEAGTPDGPKTWVVWVRAGRILAAHQYTASNRATAQREWREVEKMTGIERLDARHDLGERGMSWRRWQPLARGATTTTRVYAGGEGPRPLGHGDLVDPEVTG